MTQVLQLLNGIPTMVEFSGNIYEQTYNINALLASGTPITLPGGQTYTDDELKVYLDGKRMIPVYDLTYEGSIPRTQISFTFDVAAQSVVLYEIVSLTANYVSSYYVGATITAGTNVTLPNGETYTSTELKIYVDGKRQYLTSDFNYVGSPPRTQVTFTFDIAAGSWILFEKD